MYMEESFVLNNLKFIKKIIDSPNQYQLPKGTVEVSNNDETVEVSKIYTTKIETNVNNDKYYIKDFGIGSELFLYKGQSYVKEIGEGDNKIQQQPNRDSSARQNGTFYYLVESDTTGGRKKNKTRKSKKHKKSKKYKKSKSRRSRKYRK